jgi:hypothetical protein
MPAPIFSKDYYSASWMFKEFYKQFSVEKEPDGTPRFTNGFFTDLWKFRKVHSLVDRSGTIATVPFSFFDELKRYITLNQDSNLIAVHRKLKNLEVQIQNPLSPELQTLRQEIHNEGSQGSVNLKLNLHELSSCFEKGNQKPMLTLTLLKVVNFICKQLNWQLIEVYHYEPINLTLFEERAIRPAVS